MWVYILVTVILAWLTVGFFDSCQKAIKELEEMQADIDHVNYMYYQDLESRQH